MARKLFADRGDAGKALAAAVKRELGEGLVSQRPLVLAIPRGGVPIGRDVAVAVGGDLDLVVPRKVGAEGNSEYAIGEFYEKFGQVSDEEVEETLKDYWKKPTKASRGL